MNCPHCGKDLPADAITCSNCGKNLAGQSPAPTINQTIETGGGAVIEAPVNTGGGDFIGRDLNIGQVNGPVIIGQGSLEQQRRRRDLRVLLNKVQDFWVKGVLERSVQGAALIELGKQTRPDALQRPFADVLPAQPEQPCELGAAKIGSLFDQAEHALLILDGAGSGKTTTLLELARQSIQKAAADPIAPVPVVLNLSSWPGAHQAIAEWAVEEMSLRYQIPREMGKEWLANSDVALLLDGLDEVRPDLLPACISALNQFRQSCGLVQIAISARTQDYLSARDRLCLAQAVQLEPLTDEQVDQYLAAGRPNTTTLQTILETDSDLQMLAQSPQMLNMMRLAFEKVPLEAIQSERFDTPEERRAYLLEAYTQRMFEQYGAAKAGQDQAAYSRQARRWLGSLARGMLKQGQSIFQIEQLQPSWLPSAAVWVYWLVTRVLVALIIGLALAGTAEVGGTPQGRAAYLGAALLTGLAVGLDDGLRSLRSAPRGSASLTRFTGALYVLRTALWAALSHALFFGLIVPQGGEMYRLAGGSALAYGLLFGLSGRDRFGGRDIQPSEALSWSWKQVRAGLLPALGLAVVVTVGVMIIFRQAEFSLVLRFGLTYAIITALALLLIFRLRGRQLDARSFPNQGTWLSVRNCALGGLLLGSISGGLYIAASYGFIQGLVVGLRVGIIAALWYGGFDALKHLVLRLLLSLTGVLPWNLPGRLNEAVRLRLMNRAGGSYLFINRLLRDYFQQF